MPQKKDSDQLKNRLRELRAARRWTQQALAGRVGVSRQTIIAIEKGQYNPTAVLAIKIAAAFEKPFAEVFWLEEPN
ncbi:MAG: helix-turn-helix transcriptional regulator [Chloroflexota bacterium]